MADHDVEILVGLKVLILGQFETIDFIDFIDISHRSDPNSLVLYIYFSNPSA
jgi:hypothetical protein